MLTFREFKSADQIMIEGTNKISRIMLRHCSNGMISVTKKFWDEHVCDCLLAHGVNTQLETLDEQAEAKG